VVAAPTIALDKLSHVRGVLHDVTPVAESRQVV
jgi:hypothetical protein